MSAVGAPTHADVFVEVNKKLFINTKTFKKRPTSIA
jgi:hypothetical protein